MNEKHKLMKPKDPARSGRQASQRAKKWQSRLSAALLCTLLFTVFFPSCKDEDLLPSAGTRVDITRADAAGNSEGLIQQSDGTWRAMQRVPLVGAGRIIDNFASSLLNVGSGIYPLEADNIIDTDLTNTYDVGSLIGADVGAGQIVSIRDLNYTYQKGQKVGFVCRNEDSSVLTLEVLEMFSLELYKEGVKQGETYVFDTGKTGLLALGVGNITNGSDEVKKTFVMEITAKDDFDEVRLLKGGVSVNLANVFEVYYAYVGDNPIIPAINDDNSSSLSSQYFYNEVKAPYELSSGYSEEVSLDKLIDPDLTNGILIETLSELFADPYMTVDFGRMVPAGSEVGFYVTSADVLNVEIGDGIILSTYGENDEQPIEQYTQHSIISLEVAGGGANWFSITTSQACQKVRIKFDGFNIKLGGSLIRYAYVREPTKVDISSYFTLTNATVYNPNYRFADIDLEQAEKDGFLGANVTYELIGAQPYEKATLLTNEYNKTVLANMLAQGDYTVQGTFTYNDTEGNEHKIVRTCTITRLVKDQTYCNTALINKENIDNEYTAYAPENGDNFESLINIGGVSTTGEYSNVVDPYINNYIQFNNVNIEVGNDIGIVGVRGSKLIYEPDEEHPAARVGFVIGRSETVLGANVLNFLRIRLLDENGQVVDTGVGKDNNGVSLSLIGTSSSGQARLSIDTDKSFQAVELYSSGLININLGSTLKVYYAFCEDAAKDCGTPGEECMQLITSANYGATATVIQEGLGNVISVFENFGNMLDGDMETFAIASETVTLASGTTLSVKFNPIPTGTEVGLILSGITGVANLAVIGIEKIVVLSNGNIVGSTATGDGIGLKVAGNGDKSYVSITPPSSDQYPTINELQFIRGDGVGALDNIKYHGVYLRPDYDRDGVMDCVDDELTTNIVDLKPTPADICEGNSTSLVVSGGEEGKEYELAIRDYKSGKSFDKTYTVKLNSSSAFEFVEGDPIPDLKPGIYYLTVENPANQNSPYINGIELTIHPHETKWLGTTSTDWNTWGNWTNGVPWDCSNVFIPANVEKYPVLSASGTEEYWCNNIHFAPGAELIGQSHLHYTQAFVDMNLSSGAYHLISAPLQDMVTGDMFVAKNVNDWETWRTTLSDGQHPNFFMPIDGDKHGNDDNSVYVEQRRNPYIYQRFWNSAVRNETLTRSYNTTDNAITEFTDWSRSFNAVETNYEVGQGFALKAGDKTNATPYHFHFPKSFSTYHYYGINGNSLKESSITRTEQQTGRLWTAEQINELTLERKTSGTLYLFGNPFMAHINIKKFLDANRSVSSVKVYKDGQYVDITSSNGANGAQIAPMQAVFLTATEGTSLRVTLSEDMLEQGSSSTKLTREMPDQMRLTATSNGHSASCTIVSSSSGNDKFNSREDVTLLVGSEEGSGVAVYTIADGKALSIQRMKSATRIPVGFYLKQTGDVSLTFDASDNTWNGWKLKDEQTGRSYPINGRITLNDVSTGSGRFFLEKVQ